MIWTVVLIGLVISGWGAALCIRRDLREVEEGNDRYEAKIRELVIELNQRDKIVEAKSAEIARLAAVLVDVRAECGRYHAENKRLQGLAIDKECDCDDLHGETQTAVAALRAVRDLASNYLAAIETPSPPTEVVYNVGP